jgi:hypothetical protein
VVVVPVPVSSTKASGAVLTAPVALFQFDFGTNPATSDVPIATSVPTKSMLITFVDDPPEAITFNVTMAVCVRAPLVPVMVTVELPVDVLAVVVMVRVELLPPGVIDVGLNVGVAPVGRPVALKVTAPVNPFNAVALTV